MLTSEKIKNSIPSHFGHVQRHIIFDLVKYGETARLNTYIRAQSHYTNYCRSIKNAVNWLKSQGLNVQYMPGRCGGDWTAYYKIEA